MGENPREADLKDAVQELRKALDKAERQQRTSATSLDKTIVSLSGGALVFSMSFAHELAPAKLYLPLLFIAWLLFAIAIVCVLFSMSKGIDEDFKIIQQAFDGLTEAEQAINMVRQGRPLKSAMVTRNLAVSSCIGRLNRGATCAFFAGVLVLGVFAGKNLLAKPKASEPTNHPAASIKSQ